MPHFKIRYWKTRDMYLLRVPVVLLITIVMLVLIAGAGRKAWRLFKYNPRGKLAHGTRLERCWAINELAKHDPTAADWDAICAAVDDPHEDVRLAAVVALGHSKRRKFIPKLTALAVNSPSVAVRTQALKAMAELGGEAVWRSIQALLADREARVRAAAAACLGHYGRREAIPALVPLLTDSSTSVREEVAAALRDLRHASRPGVNAVPSPPEGRLVFEAERGCHFRGNFEIAPSRNELSNLPETANRDPLFRGLEGFSGDGWIRALEGAGGHSWRSGEASCIDIGHVAYPVVIKQRGYFRFSLRVWFMDKCGDTVNIRFDSGRWLTLFTEDRPPRESFRRWQWVSYRTWDSRNKIGSWRPVYLTAGKHMLRLRSRDDGVRVDQICLQPVEMPFAYGGSLPVNYDPLAYIDCVEVTLSKETEIIDSQGHLQATARVLRGGAGPVRGFLKLDAEDGSFSCPRRIPVALAGKERVLVQDFQLTFPQGAPCRERWLTAHFTAQDGRILCETRTIIGKPWPWLLAGPLPESVGDTQKVLSNHTLRWRAIPPEKLFDRYGRMTFEQLFSKTYGHIYLKTRVYSETEKRLIWLLNADDRAVVTLDGRPVISSLHDAPAEGYLERKYRAVPPGKHEIVVHCQNKLSMGKRQPEKLYAPQNFWTFRLRVREEEHTPAAKLAGQSWDKD